MKNIGILLIPILFSCSDSRIASDAEAKIRQMAGNLVEAEVSDNLEALLGYYDVHALSMPEYQLTLEGHDEIKIYYAEILKRQNIKSYVQVPGEFIHLNNTIVEIGTFSKEYFNESNPESLVTLHGKYWYIWEAGEEGSFKLVGEAFGYFNPVSHPEELTVSMYKKQPDESDILLHKEIPFELKAYNALMEKGVRNRDGILRANFFTSDARIFPFAEPTVNGIDSIKPYLIGYSSRGQVVIDSIMCYTLDFKYAGNYVLEYDMFKVKWTNANGSGRTEGKGIRIWQRQQDSSLRLFREIGTHNLFCYAAIEILLSICSSANVAEGFFPTG